MTNTTGENRAAELLMDFHQTLFETVLTNAARDEERWSHRVKTFETLGLLDFTMASPFKPTSALDEFAADHNGERVFVLREKQLSRTAERNRLARKLKAHRTATVTRHRLRLDRDQIADGKYRRDIAKVIAYKWVINLDPDNMDMMIIRLMDVFALEHLLDTLRLNNMTARNISSYLMRRSVDELLDKNEKFQIRLGDIRARMARLEDQAVAEMSQTGDVILSRSRADLDALLSEAQLEFDSAIAVNRKEAEQDADASAQKVAERAAKNCQSPNDSFKRAVDQTVARRNVALKRLARRRRRHPTGFSLWLASRMTIVAGALFLALQIKVGSQGASLVNAICRLFELGC